MHSKFGLFQMSSLSLCAALSKVNFVVYYNIQKLIADAFMSLCEKKALRDIRTAEIIRESGVSRQTFYNYFRSREDLIFYIYRERILGHGDGCAVQADYVQGRLLYYQRLKAHSRFFRQIVRGDEGDFVQFMAATHEQLILQYLEEKRDIGEPDRELRFAADYMAQANAWLSYEWLQGRTEISCEEMAQYDEEALSDVLRPHFT